MNGWISLHRKIFSNPIVAPKKPYSKFEAWCWLIVRANHSDNKFVLGSEVIKTNEGEVVTSQKKLQQQFGWGNTRVRTYLKLLQSDEMIALKTTAKRTHITICNYTSYQDKQTKTKSKPNRKQTDTKLIPNTIDNVNKVNNVNKKNIKSEIFTELNIEKYGKRMLDVFHDYWIEPLQKNGKPKFTAEKAWSTGGRLATWSRNDYEGFYKAHIEEKFRARHDKVNQKKVFSDDEIATSDEVKEIVGETKFKLRSM